MSAASSEAVEQLRASDPALLASLQADVAGLLRKGDSMTNDEFDSQLRRTAAKLDASSPATAGRGAVPRVNAFDVMRGPDRGGHRLSARIDKDGVLYTCCRCAATQTFTFGVFGSHETPLSARTKMGQCLGKH